VRRAVRWSLRWFFGRIVAIYFREIEVVGEVPEADVRGRMFAANHVNGLIDPILLLTSAPCAVSPIAKAPLWDVPVLRFLLDAMDAVPIVRRRDDPAKDAAANDAVFARVGSHLGRGGNVLIFPEGTSHNASRLAPLRSGAGRMLARSRSGGGEGLTFQAVGLEFDARDVFRSRVLLVYGEVRSLDRLAARVAAHRGDLAVAVTRQLAIDLAGLVVEGDTWDERVLVARVAEMFANQSGDRSFAGWNAIGQRVETANAVLKRADSRLRDDLARSVRDYYAELDRTGLGDADVSAGPTRPKPLRAVRAAFLIAVAPLALFGAVVYFLPYQVPRLVAGTAKERDVVSTYKLGAGLLVYPAWASLLVAAAWALLPVADALGWTAALVAAPFAALAWMDRAETIQRRVRRVFAGPPSLERLRARRRDVMERLETAREQIEAV